MATTNFNLMKSSPVVLFSDYIPGGLPVSKNFTSNGGNLLIFFSGSGYSKTANNPFIGAELLINGNHVATIRCGTNEANSHKTFVPVMVPFTSVLASNVFTINATPGTLTDANDYFGVTIMEYNWL